jgi:hypothetical protein
VSGNPVATTANDAGPRRVILLGASNLTKAIGPVVEAVRTSWGRPLEVLAALGHGRSYGMTSGIYGRRLPGILQCGLWRDLAQAPPAPTAALVTDIGNDLLYEQPVERIAGWIEQCFDRLAEAQATTVVTLLPLDNLPSITLAKFYFFRTLFVPHSRLALADAIERARAVDDRVERLALDRNFVALRPRADWYGIDPIHIRLRHRRSAWREILSHFPGGEAVRVPRATVLQTLYLRTRIPERRRLLGFEQCGSQPSARLRDGTTVAIY